MKPSLYRHLILLLLPISVFGCNQSPSIKSYPPVDALPDSIHRPADYVIAKGQVLSIKSAPKTRLAEYEDKMHELFERCNSIIDRNDANELMDLLHIDFKHVLMNGRWQDIVVSEIPSAALNLLDADPTVTATLESRLIDYVDVDGGRSSPDREIVTARALASVASTPDSRAMTLARELRDHAIAWSKRRGERGEIDRVEKNSKRVDRFAELRTNSQLREKVIKDRRRSALRKLKGISDPEY